MKINQLQISNFKLFAESEFFFHPEFNLVIGINGTGKTSLLRAIAVALGGWAHAYIKDHGNRRPILDDEIREIQQEKRFDKAKEVSIKASGTAAIVDRYAQRKQGKAEWTRYRVESARGTYISGQIDYGSGTQYNLNFGQLGSDILKYIERGYNFDLPLFAFYECDRLWLPKHELNAEDSATSRNSRFDPYIDCFHTGADHTAVGKWLLKHELASLQQKEETPTLLSIRNAARAALDGCTGLRFDFEESRVMIEFEDGKAIPFEHLSDGQRTMLGLFCDLARRAAVLNPHLGGDACAKTSGVVLIDELDLHLHPRWQRRIIEDLRRTFPKIQFICTTHSPFLIQSLRSGDELIVMDGMATSELHNLGIEQIASGIMGVENPEVSSEYMRQLNAAREYIAELDDAAKSPTDRLESFKEQLASKLAPFADNPAFQAVLEAERKSKLGQ